VSVDDVSARWADRLVGDPDARLAAHEDLAFWRGYAARYDASMGPDGAHARTLDRLRSLVLASDSVLDVGAGTGRYTRDLAPCVQSVTALDHSPDMLALARAEIRRRSLTNVQFVEEEFRAGDRLAPHDVVLAAWSMYRQVDLVGALQTLTRATRRLLVIICGTGVPPAHAAVVEALCGSWPEPTEPWHLWIAEALWHMGHTADISIVTERRELVASSPEELSELIAPTKSSIATIDALTDALMSEFVSFDDGWHFRFDDSVAMVTSSIS